MSKAELPGDRERRLQELEQALSDREHELELLKETANAVGGQLDLDTVLQLIADRARRLIQAETLLIPILDENCREYTYRAGAGKNAEEIIGESLPLNYGVCGWVWRHRRPWWRGMLDELTEVERNRWEREAGTLIMVPLMGKGHFLGGIAGINKIGAEEFSRQDLNLLTLFASQVSIAIENAMAYAELAKAKSEAEAYQSDLSQLNSELTTINKELERIALYDQLTGLPNRLLIQDRLQQALFAAQRGNYQVAVMMVDLDSFKEVNDTLGHDAGDQLLKQVSERFSAELRHTDTVGRLGGDEFALIIPGASTEIAAQIAGNLLKSLDTEFEIENMRFSVGASIGVAFYPEDGADVATVLKHADMAMYIAKRNHDGFTLYNAEEDSFQPGRLTMATDLRQAMVNREFDMHYQPKIDLRTGALYGVEALARWPHSERGFVRPAEFVPILEHTGMIRAFSLWAIERGLHQCAVWQGMGLDLTVAVNLSMQNLLDPRFPDQLINLIERAKLPKPGLVLEITESVFLSEHSKVRGVLSLLQKQGVSFSIDDFGTGHSSLSRLKKLPVSELKIDQSFVKDMEQDRDDAIIVRSTIDLAHNLGLQVIAEGVTNESTLRLLTDMGCDMAQGFYISRPLPVDEFHFFIENTRWKVNKLPLSAARSG